MDQDFSAVVEIKDPDMKAEIMSFLDGCSGKQSEGGYFDLEKSVLHLKNCAPLTVSTFEEKVKKSSIFIKEKKGFRESGHRKILMSDVWVANQDSEIVVSKNQETNVISEGQISLGKLSRASLTLKEPSETFTVGKKESEEIKDQLFKMFSERHQMFFDEIQDELNQPRGHLQNILSEICEKRKERNKFLYCLKDIYMFPGDDDDLKKFKKVKRS